MQQESPKNVQGAIELSFVCKVYPGLRDEAEAACSHLAELYSTIPRSVCDNCGRCCSLTEDEFVRGYVIMFPLYAVEYLNIVRFVLAHFAELEQQRVFGSADEHPMRCSFRDEQKRVCTIYRARPLICRVYGMLGEDDIQGALKRHAEDVPASWLNAFAEMERSMYCPNVRIVDTSGLDDYLDRRARFAYSLQLEELSRQVHLLDAERQKAFSEIAGVQSITRWTWGGYNRIVFSTLEWMQTELAAHWPSFQLVRKT